MPEPDLYRPLIGMSVRLTERLTSRLPNVYRSRSTTPGRLATKINIVTATGSLTGQRSVPGHRSHQPSVSLRVACSSAQP